MDNINRGRFTLSANIILTASLITRTLTLGLAIVIAYMKAKDAIFDDNVNRMVNLESSYGMPLGYSVKSIAYSMIGLFLLEVISGVCGTVGALLKKKTFLVFAVLLSSLSLVTYTIYIVLLAIIYHKTNLLNSCLAPYAYAYWYIMTNGYFTNEYISPNYYYNVYPGFLNKLGCGTSQEELYTCGSFYKEQVRTYLEAYFGVIISCMLCQVASIIATEYTYRKLEFKEHRNDLSKNSYFLLLTLRHGIARKVAVFVRQKWRESKFGFIEGTLKGTSLLVSLGLFGHGLVLGGDIMVTDGSLKYIFCQLQFYEYYFYDILVMLSASAVVFGVLGTVSSVLNVIGSWQRSSKLLKLVCITRSLLLLPKILVAIFISVLMKKINDDMRYEMNKHQDGYYGSVYPNEISRAWNGMIQLLDCCGVYTSNDTIDKPHGDIFCCNNAHESIVDIDGYDIHDYSFKYYWGCGGFRTSICSSVILYKTRMYIGWFLAITCLLTILEVICLLLTNREYNLIFAVNKEEVVNHGCFASFVSIYKRIWIELKLLLAKRFNGSITSSMYIVSTAVLLLANIALLYFAINIRYDKIFGNKDIRPLLNRICITGTTFIKAVDNFSTVVTTFVVTSTVSIVYSILILIPKKLNKWFTFMGISLWICLAIVNMVELGLWNKFDSEVPSKVTEQLENDIRLYRYSHQSKLMDTYSVSFNWNTLFVKARCCGTNSTSNLTFHESYWYKNNRDDNNQGLPVQCCTSQTDIFPYVDTEDKVCRNTPNSYHEEDCPTVIEKKLREQYTLPFVVLTSIVLAAEIIIIVLTVTCLKNQQTSRKKISDAQSMNNLEKKSSSADGKNKKKTDTVV